MMSNELDRQFKLDALDEVVGHGEKIVTMLEAGFTSTLADDFLNRLFRHFHSVKGIAGVAGFSEMASTTHRFEDVLLGLRDGKIKWNELLYQSLLDFSVVLLETVDKLRNDFSAITQLPESLNKLEESLSSQALISTSRLRVLIIDDDPDVCEVVADSLSTSMNCQIALANDGAAGLEKAMADEFDIIITDWKMPRMSGVEFLRQLRGTSGLNEMKPVIMISGYKPNLDAEDKTWENVLFMDKPLDFSRLRYFVKCALRVSA